MNLKNVGPSQVEVFIDRLSLSDIEPYLAQDSTVVFVGEPYPTGERTPMVAAGLSNLLDHAKLRRYNNHKVPELLIVVLPMTLPLSERQQTFDEALERYFSGDKVEPSEAAKNLRAKATQLLLVYRLCVAWLSRFEKGFSAPLDGLDPELVGFIKQFSDTANYLHKIMKNIVARFLGGDASFLVALKKINPPEDVHARQGMKCAIELLEMAHCLGIREYEMDRISNLFFLGFFKDCGRWQDPAVDGHAARGAMLYSQLRLLAPSLPDIAVYIAEHGNISAAKPYVYEVFFSIGSTRRRISFQYHGRPDGTADILGTMERTRQAFNADDTRPILVQPADEMFATDLICLALADRFVCEFEVGTKPADIVEQMGREITKPYEEVYDFAKELTAQPSLYAQALGALAQVHKLLPQGAVVELNDTNPDLEEAARRLGLDGALALCLGPECGLWLFGHRHKGPSLLTKPHQDTVIKPFLAPDGYPHQRLLSVLDPVVRQTFPQRAKVRYFLPESVFRAFFSARKGDIIRGIKEVKRNRK